MQAAAERAEFMPPQEPAAVRSFGLAMLAHVLLMAALAWGINWQKQPDPAGVEAELWSSLPQEAAPPPPPPPVVTAPAPVPVPAPPPPPPPPAPAPKVIEPPAPKPPDINIEREKKQREALLKKQQEEADKKKLAAAQKAEAARREREEQQARAAQEAKVAQEAKEKAAKDKAKQLADAKRLESLRQENLKRMLASAAGTGSNESQGTARQSSGPSADYAGRIRARVKPNIVFAEEISGNPSAEVEVRMSPDGTIVGKKLVKTSGVPSWDEAVLRALDRTEILPRDTDGRVHSPLILAFRPKS